MHTAPAPGGNNLIYRAGAKRVKGTGVEFLYEVLVQVLRFGRTLAYSTVMMVVRSVLAGPGVEVWEDPGIFHCDDGGGVSPGWSRC